MNIKQSCLEQFLHMFNFNLGWECFTNPCELRMTSIFKITWVEELRDHGESQQHVPRQKVLTLTFNLQGFEHNKLKYS
jgi:hypothetical protein